MIILEGIFTGLIATLIFDIFNQSLYFAYSIDRPKWNLLGRYFLGYKQGYFIRKNLVNDEEIRNELQWGYLIHYSIGIIYGLFYVFLNTWLFDYPSILLAYSIGFTSVLGAWCYLMPLAYDLGFFASKSEDRLKVMIQNLITHFVFGTGLFIGIYFI